MFKRGFAFVFAFLLIYAWMFPSYAVGSESEKMTDQITTRYQIVNQHSIQLKKANGNAKITVWILADSMAKFRNGTIKLYKYESNSWSTIKIWSNLSSLTNTFVFDNNTIPIQNGTTYKVKVSITAYTATISEPLSFSTSATL